MRFSSGISGSWSDVWKHVFSPEQSPCLEIHSLHPALFSWAALVLRSPFSESEFAKQSRMRIPVTPSSSPKLYTHPVQESSKYSFPGAPWFFHRSTTLFFHMHWNMLAVPWPSSQNVAIATKTHHRGIHHFLKKTCGSILHTYLNMAQYK